MSARIRGPSKPLYGKIQINGSKNAALPILAACILTSEPIILRNVPKVLDILVMFDILRDLGGTVDLYESSLHAGHSVKIQMSSESHASVPPELARKIRASILTLGPLLTRFGKSVLSALGGCNIGERSVHIHLKTLQKMGAEIRTTVEPDYYGQPCQFTRISISKYLSKLKGTVIHLEQPSVGVTANLLMAATLAEGVTIITNAALEPDITDLANFLVAMGAHIQGIGRQILRITGVRQLRGCEYKIIPDRHEAGTYALAAIMTNGVLELNGVHQSDFASISRELHNIGGSIIPKPGNKVIAKRRWGHKLSTTDIATNPFPNFPTDMQAPFCTALCLATNVGDIRSNSRQNVISFVHENIFENRFQHVDQLKLMGADIEFFQIEGQSPSVSSTKNYIVIRGVKSGLKGARVKATDLRSAAALVLAGLVASGETIIENIELMSRGFEDMDLKLNSCGADVTLI